MFTSNKKREKQAVGASVFMLVEFLSLFIRWIARRSLYDSYSVHVVFRNHFQIPLFRFMQKHYIFHGGTHTAHKRKEQSRAKTLFRFFYCSLPHCQMCIFTRNTANIHTAHTFMAKTQICRCFIAFYFIFYLEKNSRAHEVVRMICCHTVWILWGICHFYRDLF